MGLLYVDKTRRIFDLAPPKNRSVFLARPRRFGQSLLASTREALFQGDRALCAGTWIQASAWDWTRRRSALKIRTGLDGNPAA